MSAAVTTQNDSELSTHKYDVLVLIACVLLFFGFLVLLLNVFFPSGVRLAELENDNEAVVAAGGRGDMSINAAEGEAFTAEILQVRRSVRTRDAAGLAWSSASTGHVLQDGDALQTLGNSGALVSFSDMSQFRVGEKSLIVIRRGSADPFLARRAPSVAIMNGELDGSLAAGEGKDGVEFALPNGFVRFFGSDSETAFALRINPDESSSISVFSGSAEITANGRTVKLTANEGVTVAKDGKIGEKKNLPPAVAMFGPANNQTIGYRDVPPPVQFKWKGVPGSDGYRLTIARNAELTDIVIDKKTNTPSLQIGNLKPGRFYWTVRSVTGWLQSEAGAPRRLNVVQDLKPPTLSVDPVNDIVSGLVVLRGRTEPGARVYVQDEEAKTEASGRFAHELSVDDGANVVVIESVDTAGNVAYVSQMIHSKPLVANGGD